MHHHYRINGSRDFVLPLLGFERGLLKMSLFQGLFNSGHQIFVQLRSNVSNSFGALSMLIYAQR